MATTDTKARVENVFMECFGEQSLEKFRDHACPFTTHAAAATAGPGATELLDSLDKVEFHMAIEDEFGLDIPDVDAETLDTLADVIAYLEPRLAAEQEDTVPL